MEPTLNELAEAAGVHRSTITRALRNDPRISVATCERIKTLAKEIGYRPNPLTSALMEARRRGKPPSYQTTIALLDCESGPDHFNERSWLYNVFRGAKAVADSQGYKMERFQVEAGRNNARQLNRILSTRNVQGLLLPPEHEATLPFDVDWQNFSVVSLHLGPSSHSPTFHQIVSNHFHSMLDACSHCCRLGYRRIGLVLRDHSASHYEYGRMIYGAFKSFLGSASDVYPIEPLLLQELDTASILEWEKREHPDCIIFAGGGFSKAYDQAQLAKDLVKGGIDLYKGVGMAVMCQRPNEGFAGMDERMEDIGGTAISLLIDQIRQNRRGIPTTPLIHLVAAHWHDDASMPARP